MRKRQIGGVRIESDNRQPHCHPLSRMGWIQFVLGCASGGAWDGSRCAAVEFNGRSGRANRVRASSFAGAGRPDSVEPVAVLAMDCIRNNAATEVLPYWFGRTGGRIVHDSV